MLSVSLPELEKTLPGFISGQRWYRAKAKTIASLRIADEVDMGGDAHLLVVEIHYQEGGTACYLLPVTTRAAGSPISGNLHDALQDPGFRRSLLDAIACDRVFPSAQGEFAAARTSAFSQPCASSDVLESSVSRAEQSNTSIVFGRDYILKLFRKLEPGINPDIEIGKYLTGRKFENTPAVLGDFTYSPKQGDAMQAGILMQFVANRGDAWAYTLEFLRPFFEEALRTGEPPPQLPTGNPLELSSHPIPEIAFETIGEYLDSARLLGARTAEMHAALAAATTEPDFVPESFTPEYASSLYREMMDQAEITFGLLRDKRNMLPEQAAADARALIEAEDRVRRQFESLRGDRLQAVRIRHHGDYHLGQVLWTGVDFVIIDFEGEPARPLTDRRIKTFAMRDVAGMVRSFSYAGYAALFGQVKGIDAQSAARGRIEAWSGFWAAWVSAAYLQAYLETANGAPFVGPDEREHRLLFDAFTLQKALYEVAYELNNRPGWVRIPLRGILNLIGNHGRRTQFAQR